MQALLNDVAAKKENFVRDLWANFYEMKIFFVPPCVQECRGWPSTLARWKVRNSADRRFPWRPYEAGPPIFRHRRTRFYCRCLRRDHDVSPMASGARTLFRAIETQHNELAPGICNPVMASNLVDHTLVSQASPDQS